jgi:lipopolysaccharide export system protein LptC
MSLPSWRTVLTLVLLVAAAMSGWSVWTHRPDARSAPVVDARSDYLLHDFELTALDKQGNESFTLRAPTLERHPGDRTMTLATPLFLLPVGDGTAYWEVRSQKGWVSAEGDEVRLTGDVKATSPAGATPTTFATQTLNVFPKSNRASSRDAVTITRPGSILRGRGFDANLKSKRYALLADVRTRYAPTR